MKSCLLVCASVALGVCICSASVTKASGSYRVVAASGELSGAGSSTFTSFFWGASFDPAGRVNLRADTTGVHGVWIDQPGGLTPALGTPGTAFGFPTGASIEHLYKGGPIAQNGYSTAIGYISGGGVTGFPNAVFASGADGAFRLAERSGQSMSGMPGVSIVPQGGPDILSNHDGDLVVQGALVGGQFGTSTQAIWLERGLGPELAFYTGMPAPGFSAGVLMQSTAFSKFGVAIDKDQRIAYGGSAATSKGIWLFDSDAPVTHRLVARTEPLTTVTTFSQLSDLQLTQDRIVFQATVNVPGSSAKNALIAETNGTLETIAKVGDPAPGLGPTDLFENGITNFSVERVAVNDQGDIAFAAGTLDSLVPNKRTQGIWIDGASADPRLAFKSNDLPGSPSLSSLQSLVMNDSGQMAFILASGTESIWFYDPNLGGQRVAAEGDVLSLILNGQLVSRTIDRLQVGSFQNDNLPASNYLSDLGHVVFVATFREGGSAVLDWSPVPEPAALALVAVTLIPGLGLRRRTRNS